MSEDTIQIFARVRPSKNPSPLFKCFATSDESRVEFSKPRDSKDGYINNQREFYEFRFNGVFDQPTKQEEIFDVVARKACQNALDGYNSTIFAYGQTGSGKTFTITGGPEKFSDRGMIPRSLSHIFEECRKRSDVQYSIYISYLEIYNNNGYDLLDPGHETQKIEDLPKVMLYEDAESNLHLRNLSAHLATSEEEALNLLFLGDTNRMISETPMNLASSRSHCIFTISLEGRQVGSDLIRRSKLHLVDLAGSERVYKTNVDGQTLMEARYINTALHFLEQVIVALSERSKGKKDVHIPYRNSLLTSVLRDSLGGNSKTVMIATINPEQSHVEESVSTCRFAMRVASIRQAAQINEEIDPKQMISRLKKQISELKEEIHFLKGQNGDEGDDIMLEADKKRCYELVNVYVEDAAPDATLVVGRMTWIQECFRVFKTLVLQSRTGGFVSNGPKPSSAPSALIQSPTKRKGAPLNFPVDIEEAPLNDAKAAILQDQVKNLQLQISQRDNEINILVSMLKKKGAKTTVSEACTQTSLNPGAPVSPSKPAPSSGSEPQESAFRSTSDAPVPVGKPSMSVLSDPNLLADRNKYFEMFRKSYRKNEMIEENKIALKTKYEEAQTEGKVVNDSRAKINHIKAQIEQLRVERAMQGLDQNGEVSSEEQQYLMEMDREKTKYKDSFAKLRDLKSEIEGIQRLLEKGKVQLQKDFEQWYLVMLQQQGLQVKRDDHANNHSAVHVSHSTSTLSSLTSHDSSSLVSSSLSSHSSSVRGSEPNLQNLKNRDQQPQSQLLHGPKQAWGASTGDAEADADIAAFYKARESLLQQRMHQKQQ
eukprot:ANDGO_04112.mRNA.1 Kinesin-like protein KLP1